MDYNPAWAEKAYYDLLKVQETATADEIKKAYRKLAKEYHPDKTSGDLAKEAKFKEITEAYEVLGNPQKREAYDQFKRMSPLAAGGFHGFNAPSGGFGSGAQTFEDLNINLEDLFTMGSRGPRFTGFGPTAQAGARRPTATSDLSSLDIHSSVELTLLEALNGALVSISVTSPSGETTTSKIRIPAGVKNGQTLRIKGKGGTDKKGNRGDLYLALVVTHQSGFTMNKSGAVRTKASITYPEAVFGVTKQIPTPQGSFMSLQVPSGTASESVLRIPNGAGPKTDLLVEISVEVPTNLTKSQEEALRAFQKTL